MQSKEESYVEIRHCNTCDEHTEHLVTEDVAECTCCGLVTKEG
jgi:hypothetical protein